MLLFIIVEQMYSAHNYEFKYISCYCLSFRGADLWRKIKKFKYISCYCLSLHHLKQTHSLPQFKYISCYCLSRTAIFRYKSICIIQIHLMLLFIKFQLHNTVWQLHSNTSHVIVYRFWIGFDCGHCWFKYISCYCLSSKNSERKGGIFWIQIHLMLLFILLPLIVTCPDSTFKYISCYCLSINYQKKY